MLLILLGLLITTIWTFYRHKTKKMYGVPEIIMNSILGLSLGALFLVVGSVLSGTNVPIETTTTEYELVNMGDTTYADVHGNIHGSAFLVRGTISTDLSAGFSYYQKEDSGYTLKTAKATQSVIKYSNETPKVVVEQTYCKRSNPKGPTIGLLFFEMCETEKEYTHYTFYIPEGSIVERFNLGE